MGSIVTRLFGRFNRLVLRRCSSKRGWECGVSLVGYTGCGRDARDPSGMSPKLAYTPWRGCIPDFLRDLSDRGDFCLVKELVPVGGERFGMHFLTEVYPYRSSAKSVTVARDNTVSSASWSLPSTEPKGGNRLNNIFWEQALSLATTQVVWTFGGGKTRESLFRSACQRIGRQPLRNGQIIVTHCHCGWRRPCESAGRGAHW